jgi:hypothetical protein
MREGLRERRRKQAARFSSTLFHTLFSFFGTCIRPPSLFSSRRKVTTYATLGESVDRFNRAPLEYSFAPLACSFHVINQFLKREEMIVSLVKIIVFTVILILSILFFWRFLF